jgi:hypothetical protein
MERIIFLVNYFESIDIEPTTYLPSDYPVVAEIIELANEHLITEKGYCNWNNINFLKENSIHVFPIERDSFGWLLGGISTSKGIITYG